jgi:hypothetical protein
MGADLVAIAAGAFLGALVVGSAQETVAAPEPVRRLARGRNNLLTIHI